MNDSHGATDTERSRSAVPPSLRSTDVDELRNRIDRVRAWLATNHGLTYVPEEYSNGIHMLLVHGAEADDSGRTMHWDCTYEDDWVGAAGGPDTADAPELLDRIDKVETWLKMPDARDYVPTEYLIGIHTFLIHGATANPLSAQPKAIPCTCG